MRDTPIVIDLEDGFLNKKENDETDKPDEETEPSPTEGSDGEFDVNSPPNGEGNEDKSDAARSSRPNSRSPSSKKNQAEQDA